MSDGTKIEWTDATVNVINGCSLVSPGCTNCYAMKQAHRFPVRQGLTRKTKGGMVWTGELRFHRPALEQVLRWQRPRRIFWNAHGDTFHEAATLDWIEQCFAVMALTPHHTHQVLTKRPERAREFLSYRLRQHMIWAAAKQEFSRYPESEAWPLPNVWLGTSVEDQQRADERVPILLDTPAAIRWLSMEPLLGPVRDRGCLAKLDWVVLGGESGPKARPMSHAWARSIRDQCADALVPFLFKQWGDWAPVDRDRGDIILDDMPMSRLGKKAAGRLLDGVEHNGYPA